MIVGVAAALKKAKLKSAAALLNDLKLWHVEEGHEIQEWMGRLFSLAKKSVTRGLGPAKRANEVKLTSIGAMAWLESKAMGKVKAPMLAFAWASVWMLRCAELVKVKKKHITVSQEEKTISLTIPVSKMDQKGMGVRRTLMCCGRSLQQKLRVGTVVADSQLRACPGRRELLVFGGGRTRGEAERDGRSMEATVRSGRIRSFGKEIGSYDVRKSRAPVAGDCLLGEMEIQRGPDLRGRSAGRGTGKCQAAGGRNECTSSRELSNVSNWGTNIDYPNALHTSSWHTGSWHTSFEHFDGKILEL